MDLVALLPPKDRQALFQEVAIRRGLSLAIIEKDFWVCWTLRRVFELPSMGEHLIFKGGTSLSKVFGLIARFSEDIDLSIRRDYLGAVGENDPEQEGISGTRRGRRVEALRERCRLAVRAEMLPALQTSFAAHLGAAAGAPAWRLDLDPGEEGTLLFTYPLSSSSLSPAPYSQPPLSEPAPPSAAGESPTAIPAYIRPQVKLEMGAGSDPFPVGRHSVRPYAAETFPDAFQEPEAAVVALEAERTFWEKATLIHAECHRPEDRPSPPRLSRHYYDLEQLARSAVGERALADAVLRERVVRHKSVYFVSGWAHYETARPGTFRLIPGEVRLAELRRDYARMREMFFAEVPSFDDLINSLRTAEERINQGV